MLINRLIYPPVSGNPGSGKFLLLDSGVPKNGAYGIRNTAQGIQNPINEWFPESKFP